MRESERTVTQRWLDPWWPSTRLGHDPLDRVLIDGRYAPVSVANWKLTPGMKRLLLEKRIPRPLTFAADQRLTIVIPFRDRQEHLDYLVPILSGALSKQPLRSRILVVEQVGNDLFNRGKLINVGMHYMAQESDYYCVHDVDAIPLEANYLCPSQPLRLVSKVRTTDGQWHRTPYYFSGAVSVRREHAFAANGFSNGYRGWGKEDDDFFFRLLLADYLCYYDTQGFFEDLPNPPHQQVERRSIQTLPHVRINRNRRSRLLRGLADPREDGLSTLDYKVLSNERADGYEKISVRL
jgi:beta-1,4-galactosyltransferase 1